MKGKLIRPALVGLVIVGALLVAGGIAYATIPDSSGVIHACYHVNGQGLVDGSGTMRVIDPSSTNKDGSACKHDEKALDFNQTGPPGPPGPSDVWSVNGFGAGQKGVPVSPNWVDLATTSLPAGSYFVQAETTADTFQTGSTDFFCDLVDSANNEYQFERVTSPPTITDWVTIPVQAVVTLGSPDTITFRCSASVPSEAFNWQLAAIKVGTVHQ